MHIAIESFSQINEYLNLLQSLKKPEWWWRPTVSFTNKNNLLNSLSTLCMAVNEVENYFQ